MSSSLEDDWVEVSDAPTDFDAEDGRMLSSLAASSNHCGALANETEEADTPPVEIAVLASSRESAVSSDSHCSDPVETPIQSQICTSELSTSSTKTSEHLSVVHDERDAEIAQLKSRVQAMELGIHALHTAMIANPGIRRAIKSAHSTNSGAEGSNSSCLAVADELTDDVGYELTEVLEATKKLGVALTTHTPQFPKLSFLNFEVGDIVLFMPALVNGQQIWMAFNSGQPNYFLSEVRRSRLR